MKRFSAGVVCLAMSIALCGCSSSGPIDKYIEEPCVSYFLTGEYASDMQEVIEFSQDGKYDDDASAAITRITENVQAMRNVDSTDESVKPYHERLYKGVSELTDGCLGYIDAGKINGGIDGADPLDIDSLTDALERGNEGTQAAIEDISSVSNDLGVTS